MSCGDRPGGAGAVGLHRRAEAVHLSARVVEVVLALDRPARRLEHACERVAQRGVAGVTDVQRPGRVRAHELDLRAPAVRLGAAVGLATDRHVSERVGQPARREAEVDEPRAGHLRRTDEGRLRQVPSDQLRHLTRRALDPGREDERHVRREVAVLLLPRLRELDLGKITRQTELAGGRDQCLGHERDQAFFDHRSTKRSRRTPLQRRRPATAGALLDSGQRALVAQRIERRPPEPEAQVRVLPRAPERG